MYISMWSMKRYPEKKKSKMPKLNALCLQVGSGRNIERYLIPQWLNQNSVQGTFNNNTLPNYTKAIHHKEKLLKLLTKTYAIKTSQLLNITPPRQVQVSELLLGKIKTQNITIRFNEIQH